MMLYEDQRAPNPRRVRIFLAEKGIEVARRHVDIMAGDHKSADMLKLNRFARLPILVLDDGRAISESIAICRYFEVLQPEPSLFGMGPVEQASIEMWQRRIELYLFLPITYAFRHGNPRMAQLEAPQVREWAEANIPKINEMLDFLDLELEQRPFIAGDQFSVADITALCAIDFMRVLRMGIKDEQASLRRWHDAVSSRPSSRA